MRDELMTGWLSSNTFISDMTVQSFSDIGFTVVPEPTSASWLLLGAIAMICRRERAA